MWKKSPWRCSQLQICVYILSILKRAKFEVSTYFPLERAPSPRGPTLSVLSDLFVHINHFYVRFVGRNFSITQTINLLLD